MDERLGTDTNGQAWVARAAADEERLRLLRGEIGELVRELPGNLAALSARIGMVELEISWAATPAPHAAVNPPAPDRGAPAPGEPHAEPPGATVDAPLVGTFYRAPEPGARAFVEVGDRIDAGQTVGIVEAMKLMNHVTATHGGVVTEILARDATAVEFGEPLIRIDPDDRS